MKKYLKVLIVLVALLIIPNVYADIAGKSVAKDDVPNNTYIIGEYMFTRNTNDNYNGQLTVQLIMLAARSINGNSLEDMIIYYKNARGVWINGVSGEQVTAPNGFYVLIEDMVEVPTVPKLAIAGAGVDESEFGILLAIDDNRKGEVSCSIDDEEWEIIGEYDFNHNIGTITETPVNYYAPQGSLTVNHAGPYGSIKCKVRTYFENGSEKIYSGYSNEVESSNILESPTLSAMGAGGYINPDTGEDISSIIFQLRNFIDGLDIVGWVPNNGGVELYESTSADGEFRLAATIPYADINPDDCTFSYDGVTGYHYYKVRLYSEVGGQMYYSTYSNVFAIEMLKSAPYIENVSGDTGVSNNPTLSFVLYSNSVGGQFDIGTNEYLEIYRQLTDSGLRNNGYENVTEEAIIDQDSRSFTHTASIPFGETAYYRVRVCEDSNNHKLCGEYSNEIAVANNPATPILNGELYDPDQSLTDYALSINATDFGYYEIGYGWHTDVTGVAIFEITNDGYEEINRGHIASTVHVNVSPGTTRRFVAMVYAEVGTATIWSDYSNEVVISNP